MSNQTKKSHKKISKTLLKEFYEKPIKLCNYQEFLVKEAIGEFMQLVNQGKEESESKNSKVVSLYDFQRYVFVERYKDEEEDCEE